MLGRGWLGKVWRSGVPSKRSFMRCPPRCVEEIRFSEILRCLFVQSLLLSTMLPLWGCAATHNMVPPPTSTALSITEQPANATTPLGQTATFRVVATGTGTLSYQWSRNGTAIPGATAPAYTTPAVVANNTGWTFAVTVRDSTGYIASTPAKLTVGPRSPAPGDLRFQQVDSASTGNISGWGSRLILWYPLGVGYTNSIGTPLRVGAGQCVSGVKQDCGWLYTTWRLPAGMSLSVNYWPDRLEKLDADLSGKNTPNTIVTSLDIESSNDVYAMSFMQGAASGFDYSHEVAPLSGVSALIAADGAKGRVVTAISFDDASGQVNFLSYGWASDTTTVYETSVATSTYGNIGPTAISLAQAGYIITAFGGNATDGYVLVGTRVKGDSMSRPILVSPVTNSPYPPQGYAWVGWATGSNPGNDVWLFEE